MDVLKTAIEPVTEPVTLDEVKTFLSIDIDTEDHDSLLLSLITAAREAVESYTGVSLVPSDVIAEFDSIYDVVELPYGPVTELTTITDSEGDTVTDYKTRGVTGSFMRLAYASETFVQATYVTGYTVVPEALKTAIKKRVADDFEQRTGFTLTGQGLLQVSPNDWKAQAAPYSRKTW
jgi:hypothetical protein